MIIVAPRESVSLSSRARNDLSRPPATTKPNQSYR